MKESSPDSPETRPLALLAQFGRWCQANPVSAALLLTLAGTLVYFFGFFKLDGFLSLTSWSLMRWSPGYNMEHGKFVPFISLFLLWYHRGELQRAPRRGSNRGLIFLGIGLFLYVLAARCLQPRIALASLPFLLYGTVLFLGGPKLARLTLFPLAFLIFMIPVAALEQATFKLQFIITEAVQFLATLIGLKVNALGTSLMAADNSFNFEIAEGCSGIRSLTAMTMLAAIFVHLTQKEAWKKVTIFALSALFAIVGNIGRIFTVILVARFYDPKIAGGIYHDYSGYLFFPIAVAAMIGFSKLLNLKLSWPAAEEQKPISKERVTYDY